MGHSKLAFLYVSHGQISGLYCALFDLVHQLVMEILVFLLSTMLVVVIWERERIQPHFAQFTGHALTASNRPVVGSQRLPSSLNKEPGALTSSLTLTPRQMGGQGHGALCCDASI